MKIAAGCFGCLAFIFLALMFLTTPIYTMAVNASPDIATTLGPVIGYMQYVNSGCCCLSAVLCVVLLAVGAMGKKGDELE
ncbi:MAG: hypothetical protein ACOZNI_13200 [Myxococcota bacterium]